MFERKLPQFCAIEIEINVLHVFKSDDLNILHLKIYDEKTWLASPTKVIELIDPKYTIPDLLCHI